MDKVMLSIPQRKRITRDIHLVDLVRKSNEQRAVSLLYQRHRGFVFFRILKLIGKYEEAEEITNEAFVRAFGGIHSYNNKYAFSTWVNSIATNIFIDRVRVKSKRVIHVRIDQNRVDDGRDVWKYELPSNALTAEEVLIKIEIKKRLHVCINLLNPCYKQVIKMRYFKNYSLKEISYQTNKPLGTIKVQIRRAKLKLREYMEAA